MRERNEPLREARKGTIKKPTSLGRRSNVVI